MATTPEIRTVRSGEVTLDVRVAGSGPPVVLVHGYPDTQDVWARVVPLLAADHTVVTYDVRGAGGSSAPSSRDGYRRERLVDDLVAVIDAVVPGQAVDLVGHDWGSVQLWEAVLEEDSDPRLRGRLRSFTSISGPPLDLFGRFFRDSMRRGRVLAVARQAARSWYIGAFQVPLVPELVLSRAGGVLRRVIERGERFGDDAHFASTFTADATHGLNLYRANITGVASGPRRTQVPVQLVVPLHDRFLTPAVYERLDRLAPHLQRVEIAAGHWAVRTHPESIARTIASFTAAQRGSGTSGPV